MRCWQHVSAMSNITPRYVGSEQKGIVSLLWLTFSSLLASMLRWKTASTAFVVLRFNFPGREVFTGGCHVIAKHPSTVCQSPLACMIVGLLVYVYFV